MEKWKEIFKHKSRNDWYLVYSELNQDELYELNNNWYEYENNSNKLLLYSIITVKACDAYTTSTLYNRVYNPIIISIGLPPISKIEKDDKENILYNMSVSIKSIDDSSYTIYFEKISLKTLEYIKLELMKYIDSLYFINGNELLNKCELLGANPETKNYD